MKPHEAAALLCVGIAVIIVYVSFVNHVLPVPQEWTRVEKGSYE